MRLLTSHLAELGVASLERMDKVSGCSWVLDTGFVGAEIVVGWNVWLWLRRRS